MSELAEIIEALRQGVGISDAAIDELERTLDALRAEGWSGSIPADEAVKALAA